MRHFLEEVQATYDAGIYGAALAAGLIIPDACGAIEYPSIKKTAIAIYHFMITLSLLIRMVAHFYWETLFGSSGMP